MSVNLTFHWPPVSIMFKLQFTRRHIDANNTRKKHDKQAVWSNSKHGFIPHYHVGLSMPVS